MRDVPIQKECFTVWTRESNSLVVLLSFFWQKTLEWVVRVIVVSWQSKHKPLRQPGHYGVGLGRTRNKQLQFVVGGWVGEIPTFFWRLGMCNGTHNRDSPSDTFGTQTSDIPRQRESCEPPMAIPQSLAESQPIPLEIPWRSWYPPWLVHAPLYSNRNNTQALAWWDCSSYPQSHHSLLSQCLRSKRWFVAGWQSQNLSLQNSSWVQSY